MPSRRWKSSKRSGWRRLRNNVAPGPARPRALQVALGKLGGRLVSEGRALGKPGAEGCTITFKHASPKEFARCAWETWRGKLFAASQASGGARRIALGGSADSWYLQLATDFLKTTWFVGRAWSLPLQHLAGVAPHGFVATSAWMANRWDVRMRSEGRGCTQASRLST